MRKADVPQLLLEAFPTFHLADEASDFPHLEYLVVAVFARQAAAVANGGNLGDFPGLFKVIEQGLEEGDESAQTLLVAGFLEDLQSAAVRQAVPGGSFDPDIFTQWMGPKTSEAWRGLLTGLRGSPIDLKTLLQQLHQMRDPSTMTKVELQMLRRADRRGQRKKSRKGK